MFRSLHTSDEARSKLWTQPFDAGSRGDAATSRVLRVPGSAPDRRTSPCGSPTEPALARILRVNHFARGFGASDRERFVGQQADLLQHGGLVPVDVLVGEFTVAKPHDRD
jgi:hypothetical protein